MEGAELIYLLDESRKDSSIDRSHIVQLIRKWGGATSDALLDPKTKIFSTQEIDGFIGYRREIGCVVVFGDPVCSIGDREALTKAFHDFVKQHRLGIVYVAVSQPFAKWAIKHVCSSMIEFGEELIFDPTFDPRQRTGTHGSLVRRKVKRAVKEGVTIHEYLSDNLEVERAIEETGLIWLRSRRGPQMHISSVYLFNDRNGKRWFYAKQGDRIIGSISLNMLQAYNGWLINHLMVIPEAPHGTHELLLVSVLEALAKEGCHHASVGMIAAQQLGEIIGLSSISAWVARNVFKIARKQLNLGGLNTFWGKFHPDSKPSYLLFSRDRIGLREILSLSRAMNGPI